MIDKKQILEKIKIESEEAPVRLGWHNDGTVEANDIKKAFEFGAGRTMDMVEKGIEEWQSNIYHRRDYLAIFLMRNVKTENLEKEVDAIFGWKTKLDEAIELLKHIDKSLYTGEDLKDKDVMAFYIGVMDEIKNGIKEFLEK